jgi:von Willebrand factor A domain-containing protein 7
MTGATACAILAAMHLFVFLMLTLLLQANTSRSFGPGACGPGDPTYVELATETGGQPFFMSPSEVGLSAHIMTSERDDAMILWASGTGPDGARGFTIPVDSSINRLSLLTSFDRTGGTVTVVGPDGQPSRRDERTQETVLNCGRVLTIDAPAAGAWRVTLQPSDRFWLVVRARSEIDILSAEFVRPGGRPGHEGLFKISGQPTAGQPAILRVSLAETALKSPQFLLISTRGQRLQQVQLERASDSGNEFSGTIDLPTEPFRVAVAGLDRADVPYRRVHNRLFRAALVEVRPASVVENIAPGEETVLEFDVMNVGPSSRFQIVAIDARQFVTRVEPTTVDLDRGAAQRVSVWLRVPAGTAPGTSDDLTITASSRGARPTSNAAVVPLTVAER